MSQTKYDPTLIQTYADKLYTEANAIVRNCTILGIGLGVLLGFLLFAIMQSSRIPQGTIIVVGAFSAVIFAIIGNRIGRSKAFAIKLRAQEALCQMQIEKNTRPPTE